MRTSNTNKSSSTPATSYSAYAKAAGIFIMTTGLFLFAKTTGYLFSSFFSRKTDEDVSTALVAADETQFVVPLMQDTFSSNQNNKFGRSVTTGNSMATDALDSEQVQFTELTLPKNTKPNKEIAQPIQTNHQLMTVPLTDEVQVNTYTASYQDFIRIGVQPNRNFLITWRSGEQDGDQGGIYAQRFDENFIRLGSEFRVNTYTTEAQEFPTIGVQLDGSFIISWSSANQDGSGRGIYAQRFDASNSPVGAEFRVNTYTNGNQNKPSIGVQSNGNFIITWESQNGQDGYDSGVYAQRFNSEGITLGSEFQVNTHTPGYQTYPVIAVQPNDNFIIAWESQTGQDGSGGGIYAQRFNTNASPIGSEFRMNSITTGSQGEPTIATYSNGNFIAAWYSPDQAQAVYDIYARLFDANGTPLNSDFIVNSYPNDGNNKGSADVGVWQLTNEFVVAWNAYTESGVDQIFARRFNASASPLGLDFQVNTFLENDKRRPCIGIMSSSEFVIGWESTNGQDGDGTGIYARQFQLDPPLLNTNQLTITEDQSVTFTSAELSATDPDSNHAALIFTVSNVMHGRFELSTNAGVSITSFTQQQIIDGVVQFVHDGSHHAPAYEVSVSDGGLTTTPASAAITYIPLLHSSSSTGLSISSSSGSSSNSISDSSSTAFFSATGDVSSSENDEGRSSSTTHHSETESSSGSNTLNSSSSTNTLSAAYQALIVVCSLIGTVGGAIVLLWASGKGTFDTCGVFARKNRERAKENEFAAELYLALKIGNLRIKSFDREDGIEGDEFLKAANKLETNFVKQRGFNFQEKYENKIKNIPHGEIVRLCECMAQAIREDEVMKTSNKISFFGNQPSFMDFLSKLQKRTEHIAKETQRRILENEGETYSFQVSVDEKENSFDIELSSLNRAECSI